MRDKEIALEQHEQKMKVLISQMDNLYCEIKDAMPISAASWITKEVESRIKDSHETVQLLGTEKLCELKSKLNDLKEKLHEIVEAEFHDRNKWPHHIECKEEQYSSSPHEEHHLNKAFRNVISNLGGILDEFGLIKGTKGHIPSWERIGPKQFRYAINPGLDNLPESKIIQYNNFFSEYISLSRMIKDTRKSLAEAKAKELWDRA